MTKDARSKAATEVARLDLLPLCLDADPKVIHAVLTNPNAGPEDARWSRSTTLRLGLMLMRGGLDRRHQLRQNAPSRSELPAYAEARVESADLTEVLPTDLVVLLVDGKPVFGIVVEVQLELKADDRKFFTWPSYVANLRAYLECETCVLVVTPSDAVAARASKPIRLGPGSTVIPFVVGPKAVPVVRDAEVAKRDPELAVLSAMAHGGEEPELAVQIAVAACAGAAALDDERALPYSDLIRISLGEAARRAFEDLMATGNYEYQSDFARKYDALGRAKGEASAVLKVLAARHVAVTEEQKTRILACIDLKLLDRWIEKAVTVTSADELFTD